MMKSAIVMLGALAQSTEVKVWTDWQNEGACDALCGGGKQKQTRTCLVEDLCYGYLEQDVDCNMQPCETRTIKQWCRERPVRGGYFCNRKPGKRTACKAPMPCAELDDKCSVTTRSTNVGVGAFKRTWRLYKCTIDIETPEPPSTKVELGREEQWCRLKSLNRVRKGVYCSPVRSRTKCDPDAMPCDLVFSMLETSKIYDQEDEMACEIKETAQFGRWRKREWHRVECAPTGSSANDQQ